LCLIVAHFECPDMTHPRLFHVTAGLLRSSMEEFLRRRTASEDDCPSAAKKVDRFTVAHKKDTSAETYGEPQTPADPR